MPECHLPSMPATRVSAGAYMAGMTWGSLGFSELKAEVLVPPGPSLARRLAVLLASGAAGSVIHWW